MHTLASRRENELYLSSSGLERRVKWMQRRERVGGSCDCSCCIGWSWFSCFCLQRLRDESQRLYLSDSHAVLWLWATAFASDNFSQLYCTADLASFYRSAFVFSKFCNSPNRFASDAVVTSPGLQLKLIKDPNASAAPKKRQRAIKER